MQIRTQTLREPYVHVFSGDEALDTEADGFAETFLRAIETSDISILPMKSGKTPALWKLRHLDSGEAFWLAGRSHAGDSHEEIARHAVALAVLGVEGALGSDGKPLKFERRRDADRRGFTCVAAAQMDAVFGFHNRELVSELGGRVIEALRPRKG